MLVVGRVLWCISSSTLRTTAYFYTVDPPAQHKPFFTSLSFWNGHDASPQRLWDRYCKLVNVGWHPITCELVPLDSILLHVTPSRKSPRPNMAVSIKNMAHVPHVYWRLPFSPGSTAQEVPLSGPCKFLTSDTISDMDHSFVSHQTSLHILTQRVSE